MQKPAPPHPRRPTPAAAGPRAPAAAGSSVRRVRKKKIRRVTNVKINVWWCSAPRCCAEPKQAWALYFACAIIMQNIAYVVISAL